MDKRFAMSMLLDFYGSLLTDRQRLCMELYYDGDRSLAEIAEDTSVSRQAVHDNLQRAELLLTGYEEKLGLLAQYEERKRFVEDLRAKLARSGIQDDETERLIRALE